jgi:hypothetical protein
MKATKTLATDRPQALDTLTQIVDLIIAHRFPQKTPTLSGGEEAECDWLINCARQQKGTAARRCPFRFRGY